MITTIKKANGVKNSEINYVEPEITFSLNTLHLIFQQKHFYNLS